ncbi:putative tetratricopeptide-like helical domain superfamily [Helianthus anomalus]
MDVQHTSKPLQQLPISYPDPDPPDRNLAKSATEHANKSIAINPNDAAVHIFKAMALDLQGFTTSALEALEAALSPLAPKSLSDGERSDVLC